jgi:hypothetical protein
MVNYDCNMFIVQATDQNDVFDSHNNTQHTNIQQNDTQHVSFSKMTPSVMTFSKMTFSIMTISLCNSAK